ncbi:sulfatase-like hydrolase/transferase [Aureliella helgolandensis]|uniref:Arylsulfatase n=1 Tax=Aureliella helgolandensis TaxID=2527968 RepID=A0A518GH36_9BACT|nr:sulfatase-like hydrolase/transferase [Aureliella helgolandensis]QDV27897.1 Arylsulfatase [Aureliella helgolandensis]
MLRSPSTAQHTGSQRFSVLSCNPARLLAILVGACVQLVGGQPLIAQTDSRPDIVLIVADDLGWGDLGCFGAEDLETPSLDGLAARGQRWTNFYANCTVCSPTRASIMTGCYPDRAGVPGVIRTHASNSWGKLANLPTLPEVLSKAGYQTACVGKWHLGLSPEDHPQSRGFDSFHGFLGDMMDDYYTHRRHDIAYMRKNRTPINPAGHATSLFAGWANQAIDRMADQDQPYFLYLAFNAPHTPIQPPASALARVQQRAPEMPETRAKLVALIEDLDAAIGRVLSNIENRGRDTLIVFVSDNGGQRNVGANNGPLRDGKGSKYEGGLRVPAIACWDGQIPAGSETQAMGVTMDILPTLCEIAGSQAPTGIDGQSLTQWAQHPNAPQDPREVYFVRREGGNAYSGLTIEALRQGDWKLVHNFPTSPFELFNLATDPTESQDLSRKQPAKLRSLQSALRLHIQRGGQVPWQPIPQKPTAQ